MTEIEELQLKIQEQDKFIVNLVNELSAAYEVIEQSKDIIDFVDTIKKEIKTVAKEFNSAITVLKTKRVNYE